MMHNAGCEKVIGKNKMKAAILAQLDQPLIVDEVILPPSLGVGQVLVDVRYSGICGSQLGEIRGVKRPDKYLPHLLGHEGAGVVLEVGTGVKTAKPGDHVVMHWMKGPGIEAETPHYQWKSNPLNAGFVTTFNEYAVVSENRLTVIPEDADLRIATLLGCAVTTGLGVVTNNARLKMGESILVYGSGGVGLNVVQGAAMTSAYPIIAVDIDDEKLALAKAFGATHTINSSRQTINDEIERIAGTRGLDVTVETTGRADLIAHAYNLTHEKGRTILVGVPPKGMNASFYTLPLHFGKIITGSHGGETRPDLDIPRYLRLYEAGMLKLDEQITDVFALDEINQAIDRMRKGKIAGRCLIEL